MNTHEKFYSNNKNYTNFLKNQNPSVFKKYVKAFIKYSKKNEYILDVGCGTGSVMSIVNRKGNRNIYGIEISKTSVKECKTRKLNCKIYNGKSIPFQDNYFHVVGSFNVLEHTDDPINFLNEQYRVLRNNGYIVVVCPNFLSTTNNYHRNTRGTLKKIQNLYAIIRKTVSKKFRFDKMETTLEKSFQPDDDAVNATNPIDILKWSKSKSLKLVYWSSQQQDATKLLGLLDNGVFKCFLGACFFVFKRTDH